MLKRNLLKDFDMDRNVNARVIKDIDDKLSRFYGANELMASNYSNKAKNRRGASFWKIQSANELTNDQDILNDEEPDMRKQWLELR